MNDKILTLTSFKLDAVYTKNKDNNFSILTC